MELVILLLGLWSKLRPKCDLLFLRWHRQKRPRPRLHWIPLDCRDELRYPVGHVVWEVKSSRDRGGVGENVRGDDVVEILGDMN